MSFPATMFRQGHLLRLFLGLVCLPVLGQTPSSPISFSKSSAITVTTLEAPQVTAHIPTPYTYPYGNTEWLKVEFRYQVTPTVGDYVDAAKFKIWIEGRDLLAPDATDKTKGVAIGLTGAVTYVNIPKTTNAYGVFFVNPLTLRRYSTKLGPTDFTRKFNIHMEVSVNGQTVDSVDKNKEADPNWFAQLRPIAGMVYKQYQTPFSAYEVVRYPPILLPDDSSGAGPAK